MNLHFILHICRIHKGISSEKNNLLSVQSNTGNQDATQLRRLRSCMSSLPLPDTEHMAWKW